MIPNSLSKEWKEHKYDEEGGFSIMFVFDVK